MVTLVYAPQVTTGEGLANFANACLGSRPIAAHGGDAVGVVRRPLNDQHAAGGAEFCPLPTVSRRGSALKQKAHGSEVAFEAEAGDHADAGGGGE
jgi:hypothetical protein